VGLLLQARRRRRGLLEAQRAYQAELPHMRETEALLKTATEAVLSSKEGAKSVALPKVLANARKLDELCDELSRAIGEPTRHRRSTIMPAQPASATHEFGDLRAAYHADSGSSASAVSDAAAAKNAAAALLGSSA
jgi:hypothetical protein